MTEPVADGARAERQPAAPIPGNPEGRVGTERNGADPQIIVEAFGHVVVLVKLIEVAELAIHLLEGVTARMNGMHLADGAGPDPLADPANGTKGMPLVAELGDHFVFAGSLHQRTDFLDAVRQRLFTINMLAMLHGLQGDDRMRVIGRADDYRVDLLVHLVEHDAKVLEPPGLGILRELLGGVVIVHVAQRDHVLAFARDGVNVGASLAADADAGHVELFVGGQALSPLHRTAGEKVERGQARAGSAEKLPPVDQVGFVLVHGVIGLDLPFIC